MNFRRAALLFTLALSSGLATLHGEEPMPQTIEFNRDIRPILSDTCFLCHGPDKARRKADLRLDIEASAKAKIEDHFAIVAGDPAKSELIHRITTTDADDRMPPMDSGRQLTARQMELLKRWIEQGAKWQAHWSFIAPTHGELPKVKKSDWVRNPVDQFILSRLEQEGLSPSPEAERTALIRRVTLDLTGLPPTIEEVNAFLADTSAQAYERVVDRLLKSSRYGERMASRWLDAARYADTNGYQSDGERSMWRWRDWVIDAFNANMRFDQFTIEQLSGDLLPSATLSQRIATGFNRNHRGNAEGGIVPEEFAAEYVVDRVDTTATVWLGLTAGCARCHDHKYDPVTQKEFYQLFAFFNNVPEKGKAIKIGNSVPVLSAPTTEQEQEMAKLDAQLTEAEKHLRELEPQIASAQSAWEKKLVHETTLPWTVTSSLQARFELIGDVGKAKFEDGGDAFNQGADLDGKRFINAGDTGDFGFFDKFTLAAWIRPRAAEGAIISRMVESAEDSAFASDSEGYRVFLKAGRVQLHLTKRWLDDALRVETEASVALDQWQHVTVTYDGTRLASGVKIYVNGQPQKLRVLLDQLNQTFQTKQPLRIGAGGGPSNRFNGQIRDVRVYARALSDEEAGIVSSDESVSALAKIAVPQRTVFQATKLRACFLDDHADAPLHEASVKVASLREQRAKLLEAIPTVMVMEEMPKPRATFVLNRGQYDQHGEQVTANVPASLSALPTAKNYNRLDFAKWLVSPTHPLTARVAVNQQWQMLFGTGLVKTTEDFGSQGEPPSHPELLDWLATEFVRTGWDVKALLKTLVMSATYRQSSRSNFQVRSSPHGEEQNELGSSFYADPDNRLLAHGPRVRLSAEMIRDQALAASGLLVGTIGGPSVKPYQPPGLGKELNGTDLELDHGDKLWRRSLYTFWKRTSPQPTMMTFDASGREMCTVRPSRTSTPLQALALMNDVTFVEAARCLAQRVMHDAPTPEERVRRAFRFVLTREPRTNEMQVLLDNLNNNLTRFRANPNAAQSLITAGEAPRDVKLDPSELAAYATVMNLILNLDEAITKP